MYFEFFRLKVEKVEEDRVHRDDPDGVGQEVERGQRSAKEKRDLPTIS
jgi:hypothetical protein